MRAMRAAMSDADIAAHHGITRQRVHALLGPRKPTDHKRPRAASIGQAVKIEPAAFAAELRAWRLARGWTQRQAAEALRVSAHSISMWETGFDKCSLAASMLLLMKLISERKAP